MPIWTLLREPVVHLGFFPFGDPGANTSTDFDDLEVDLVTLKASRDEIRLHDWLNQLELRPRSAQPRLSPCEVEAVSPSKNGSWAATAVLWIGALVLLLASGRPDSLMDRLGTILMGNFVVMIPIKTLLARRSNSNDDADNESQSTDNFSCAILERFLADSSNTHHREHAESLLQLYRTDDYQPTGQ